MCERERNTPAIIKPSSVFLRRFSLLGFFFFFLFFSQAFAMLYRHPQGRKKRLRGRRGEGEKKKKTHKTPTRGKPQQFNSATSWMSPARRQLCTDVSYAHLSPGEAAKSHAVTVVSCSISLGAEGIGLQGEKSTAPSRHSGQKQHDIQVLDRAGYLRFMQNPQVFQYIFVCRG